MKSLKNCLKLSHSIKIYVPSTTNVNQHIDNSSYVDETLKFLSQCFGGATSTKALGAWVSKDGSLIKENITMVFAYATEEKLQLHIDGVYDFCLTMKAYLGQEAIALELNNELYFI